jgi:hypothetical protein
MYHFGRSYLEIHLADLGETMLVGKVIKPTFRKQYENWNLLSSFDFGSRVIFGTLYLSWAT